MSGPLLLVIAVLLVGGGLLLGLSVGRASGRAAKRRTRELEAELAAAQAAHAQYRGQVAGHFDKTSDLLRTMTLHYRTVYEHLADGARTLCPDGPAALRAGEDQALLPAGNPAPDPVASAEPGDGAEAGGANGSAAAPAEAASPDAESDAEAGPELPPRTTH